jgi:acyl-CoA synthetase (AMP-forming)/AMP-acid ligase II
MLIAIQRAGFVAFPISPRNSSAAVAHLLTKTASEYLLVGREASLQDLASAALDIMRDATTPLPHKAEMPVFEDIYSNSSKAAFEPLPPLNADLDDPCVMMHSSGTHLHSGLLQH